MKSKSYDPRSKEGLFHKSFDSEIIDIGFQYLTLAERFPEYKIVPFLLLPDKSKKTTIEGLSFYFNIMKVVSGTRFRKKKIIVDEEVIPLITSEKIITLVNVEQIVKFILPKIKLEVMNILELNANVN